MTLPRPKKREEILKDEEDLKSAVEEFNRTCNILELFTNLIAKGIESHGPCPKCGGKDRFVVQPRKNKAWCRRCKVWGDSLSWAIKMAGLDPSEKGITTKFLKEKSLL